MATKKIVTKGKNKLPATLVTGNREPCAFCKRDTDDEAIYGKLYAIGDIQVHYFCALLSCCLVQKGKDTEGLFGFLYPDIVAEVERSKKHRCSYCNHGGASLGCSVSSCRKQFHLPCGRERNAVSLFFGNYKSFCQQHAPKQKIPEHIMAQARIRMKNAKIAEKAQQNKSVTVPDKSMEEQDTSMVCVICYEAVEAYPCARSFWPPCCARDAWFHTSCLQAMALSAGMHYLKCPLCNDKEQFFDAVVSQGFYVPDRDAAWELETNAFREIYERAHPCSADQCHCPEGRSHDTDTGPWDIQLCLLCGTLGMHKACAETKQKSGGQLVAGGRWVCAVCAKCARGDISELANKIDEVIVEEQRRSVSRARGGVVMPSRMSLRRTKGRPDAPSTSRIITKPTIDLEDHKDSKSDITSARLELNLKTPRRASQASQQQIKSNVPSLYGHSPVLKTIENTIFSPTKLVENQIEKMGVKNISSEKVVFEIKEKLKKPRPLCVKKKIAHTVLAQLLLDVLDENKICSPKKDCEENTSKHTTNAEIEEFITTDLKTAGDDNENNTTKDDAGIDNKTVETEDDSSNSTFQLPSEFVADHHSDDSLPLFETPKKLTTVDIEKDSSLEISENNEVVDIKVTKIKENSANNNLFKNLKLKIALKTDKCALKFSPIDKEALQEEKVDIDVESFKNFYLNEVDRDFQCNFNHKHKNDKKEKTKKAKLRTAIDFAVDATNVKQEKRKKLKRKLITNEGFPKKKPKADNEIVVNYDNDSTNNIKLCLNESENVTESIDLTLENPKTTKNPKNNANKTEENTVDLTVKTSKSKKNKRLKKLKKLKNKKHRENIQVKIRFREKQVSLEINTKAQKKNKKFKKNGITKKLIDETKLKQYILQYTNNSSPNKVIVKPDHDVTSKKRNYVKLEKSPDALVQTSIQNFFKKVPTT